MPKYVVGSEGGYRLGQFYSPGEIVDVPEGEASKTWKPYEPPKTEQLALEAAEPKPKRAKRVSDESVL